MSTENHAARKTDCGWFASRASPDRTTFESLPTRVHTVTTSTPCRGESIPCRVGGSVTRSALKGVVGVLVGLMVVALAFATVAVGSTAAKGNAAKVASWTVMVYLDADNNLDPYAYVDVAEMEAVGSTASVNVVILWDRYTDPANLYRVTKGGIEVAKGFRLNGQEVNMGSADTLEAFVGFSIQTYPASKYALILWDHGDDFRGFAWDEHPSEGATQDDFMTHDEIVVALKSTHLDILAFDGCVMSNLEVAYEYVARGLPIDFLVASEIYIPNQGFAYDGLLQAIADHPDLGVYDFAKAVVDSYMYYYRGGGWQVGLSVVRMSAVADLVSSIGRLTTALTENMVAFRDCAGTARGNAMLSWSMYGWESYIDFPTWVRALKTCVGPDGTLGPLLDDVTAQLSIAVPYVRNTHSLDVKGAGGIGVFFPGSHASFEHNVWWHSEYYLKMRFPYEGWMDFLHSYWGDTDRP